MTVVLVIALVASPALGAGLGPARLDLGGRGWTLRRADAPAEATPATVPGTVHTDLLAAGQLPDPFYRDDEASVQWVGATAWVYARHVDVTADLLRRRHVELRCDGLETLAHVTVNGRAAGYADDMFRTWTFDVRDLLHAGDNEIAVSFDPLRPYIARRVADVRGKGRGLAVNGLGEVRVEPCCNGWDFGPRFITCGIWKPIGLVAWDGGRLAEVGVSQDLTDPRAATLAVDVRADVDGTVPLRVAVSVRRQGRLVDARQCDLARDGTGRATLTVPDPQRWWPNGMGDQPMYDVTVELTANGTAIDQAHRRIGLRTVELLAKSSGRPLGLAINGRPIFAKGVDWVPCEAFPTAVTTAKLRRLVADAKRANLNMVRCWGGGYYEEDAFYDACDEAGLLVWAEFKFACSAYPADDPAFMDDVEAEARDQVCRLRHHPCLALWSGNNEVRAIVERYGTMSEAEYDHLFHRVLGDAVHEWSPGTPYVGGSPEAGDEHNWWVWHVGAPFEKYLDSHGWMTEFGFQSFPEPRTVAAFTEAADRTSTESPVMRFHQRNGNGRGNAMITEMMGRYFRPARDFDSTLWLSQINQAMGVSLGVHHWRTDWPRSSGCLLWQYDDIWPGPTWSCVDYFGRWKAVMYRLQHDYAPLLVDGQFDARTGRVTVAVASDVASPVEAALDWALTDTAGRVVVAGHQPVHVPAGTTSVPAWDRSFDAELEQVGRGNALLWLDLTVDGRSASRQTLLFAKPKRLDLSDPHLTATAVAAGDGYDVTLSAERPALWAWLDLGADARYSDNFVDLAPGRAVTVHVVPGAAMSPEAFRAALKVRSLYDTYDPGATGAAGRPIVQAADGTAIASAAAAEIVGDSPTLEAGRPANIGSWTDPRDFLRWTVRIDRPGRFAVSAETALPGFGGPEGGYTVAVGTQHLDGTVRHTGGWQDYRTTDLGTLAVAKPGTYVVTLKPARRAAGGVVMNFRSLLLRPVTDP